MCNVHLRLLALTVITLGAIVVGAYVIVVALRDGGRGTTLGGDVIVLVYVATFSLFTSSLVLWFVDWMRQRLDRLAFLALGLASIVLGGWLYLNLSGRVISYEQMIDRFKNRPNKITGTNAPSASSPGGRRAPATAA